MKVMTTEEAKKLGTYLAIGTGKKATALLKEVFYDPISYEKGDSHHTAFSEGQRSVVHFMLNAVKLTKIEEE